VVIGELSLWIVRARRASSATRAEQSGPAVEGAAGEGASRGVGVESPPARRWQPAHAAQAGPPPEGPGGAEIPVVRPTSQKQELEALEARFRAEASDPTWSAKTAAEVRKTVADLALKGTSLRNVDCGRTLCRVVLVHEDRQAQIATPFRLTTGPFAPGVTFEYRSEPTFTTIAYLSRDPASIPR